LCTTDFGEIVKLEADPVRMINCYIHAMKNYASFKGRARRSEYWYFVLVYFIISIIGVVLDLSLGMLGEGGSGPVGLVISLVHLVPSIAIAARRMHDVDKSGWFQLVPLYNLYLCIKNGDVGSNRFGEDPKAPISNIAETFN
jgi:uncharacterized membrane protein YhaH (DUF805 family)